MPGGRRRARGVRVWKEMEGRDAWGAAARARGEDWKLELPLSKSRGAQKVIPVSLFAPPGKSMFHT